MNILLLTQYFPPEVGAAQSRLYEIAIRLQKNGAQVTVLTGMPNYPQMVVHSAYKGKFRHTEDINGLKVHRSWAFVSTNKSVLPRLLNYFSFTWSSFWRGLFLPGKFDLIICESPPLFLGITAWLLKKLRGTKLLFNVSDLWPESAEAFGVIKNRSLLKAAYRLERFIYDHSDKISGQTQGICNSIASRFPGKKPYWLPNGADTQYFDPSLVDSKWRQENGFGPSDLILFYAGLIGHAYHFDTLLDAAEKLKQHSDIKFVILGSGPDKDRITERAEMLKLNNVFFFDTVNTERLRYIIKATDVTVIPLRKSTLSAGTIPTKVFENLAMEKPVLLGVQGEAEELFIRQAQSGLSFTQEDADDLTKKILILYNDRSLLAQLGRNGRKYVCEKFDRDKIAAEFMQFLKS